MDGKPIHAAYHREIADCHSAARGQWHAHQRGFANDSAIGGKFGPVRDAFKMSLSWLEIVILRSQR